MNQRTIIYIILSVILLYLYYRRRDLAIFAAFIVVVGATLIFRDGSASEGFSVGGIGGGGGGGGADKACAKLGFTAPKIDKKDIKGSLEKVMKNVKTVADKYVIFDGNQPAPKKEYIESITFIASSEIVKTEIEKMNNSKENREYVQYFGFLTIELIHSYILKPSAEAHDKFIKIIDEANTKNDKGVSPFTMILKGGTIALDILNKIKKSDEMKEADKEVKTIIEVLICSVKQFNSIWKNIQKATALDGGDGGDGGDGEEEDKPKKKKKDDADDEEEEKPKKKKKKAKKEEDAEDDE